MGQSAISEGFTMTHYALLNDFALLSFEGEDALTFLQGQLSQDMRLVKAETALLASYSNPKGRVFATMLFWQDTHTENKYYALVRKDIAAFLQKRLRMFVLRAKVTIDIPSASIHGLWGENLTALPCVEHVITNPPLVGTSDTATPQFHAIATEQGFIIFYSTINNTQRALLIELGASPSPLSGGTLSEEAEWYKQDIQAGIPWIGDKAKELFIAQSINLDAIGAINFKKGCYPGQEVIARSHYLGQLKRRSMIGVIDTSITDTETLIGSDIMQNDTPVGQVVNASSTQNKTYLLFEVQLNALNADGLSLASTPTQRIQVKAVPYALDKPE